MLAVILAGGFGTRLAEETDVRPKPMVEIGGRPVLWHLMRHLAAHGVEDFVICLGYKGYVIKEYFANYRLHASDVVLDLGRGTQEVLRDDSESWRITLVDTGEGTETGGRLRRVVDHLPADEPFLFTYGDGLSDVDVSALVAFHRAGGRRATVTAVQPPGRFGALELDGDRVRAFREKPAGDGGWISGGYFVLEPSAVDLIDSDETVWERGPLERLAADGELGAFQHPGFWHPLDTLWDRRHLNRLWAEGEAPWRHDGR